MSQEAEALDGAEASTSSRGKSKGRSRHARVAQSSAAATQGPSVLNISSVPRSSVLVDGRPAGRTPMRMKTTPGRHTVTFVHPVGGRKSVAVRVAAGSSATAAVRFGGQAKAKAKPRKRSRARARPRPAAPAAAPRPQAGPPRLGVIQPPKVLAE